VAGDEMFVTLEAQAPHAVIRDLGQ
jgi:hypothetical protein